ncbi:MAG: hypothetical protein OS112_01330 [Methanoregula sp.]|nr:MAG: hypothetical protein OS112_01330 [Methanoregula sp.]
MRWFGERSLGWVFVTRMIGIISFLIIAVLANILMFYVSNPVYQSGVGLLNDNFWLLLIIGLIMFVADIFTAFPFPLDLPSPIVRAIGSVFIIAFILRVFEWLDFVTGSNIYQFFWFLSFILVPVVFLLVLANGYYDIIRRLFRSGMTNGAGPATPDPTIGTPRAASNGNGVKSWEEVGVEFRMMVYDILHRFREEIRGDRR